MAIRTSVLAPMAFILAGISLRAQPAASPTALAQQPAEPSAASFAFDVATIKPSDPNNPNFGDGFIASGYSLTNFPLSWIVLSAYLPSYKGNKLIGAPAWAYKENYDIVAHIDETTAPSWLKLTTDQRQETGLLMLQKLLADRCNLIVHTVPSKVDGYGLVVSKHGSRLQPAQNRDTFPDGAKNVGGDGGKVLPPTRSNNNAMIFFNASIHDLVQMMGRAAPFPVIVDLTSLTGRYDFTVHRLEMARDLDGKSIPDPRPSDLWDISATGLEIKPAKIPAQNLVIDHIERPSPN
jgi:bla regulator protein blaR1